MENILSWSHSGFSIHGAVRAESRDEAARLGRYMIRCPLVLDRMEWDVDKSEVVYHVRPRRAARPYGTVAHWDILDFIAHLTQHIPDTSEQLIRYWAFYSNATRGERRRARSPSGTSPDPNATSPPLQQDRERRRRTSWARLLKKVDELDPLLCG